jgi:hypothetical protein
MTIWFFFTRSLINCTLHIGVLIGFVLMNTINFYLYAIFIYKSLAAALKLEDLFTTASEHDLLLHLEMFIRLGDYVTIWIAVIGTVAVCILVTLTWALLKQLLEEFSIFALFGIDMYMFFYGDRLRTRSRHCVQRRRRSARKMHCRSQIRTRHTPGTSPRHRWPRGESLSGCRSASARKTVRWSADFKEMVAIEGTEALLRLSVVVKRVLQRDHESVSLHQEQESMTVSLTASPL